MIQSRLLASQSWLEHGFGTRQDGAWPETASTATLRQVHSASVAVAVSPGVLGEGDGLLTAVEDLWLAVRTADCVPILLAHPGLRIVAAVHAGWRGAAAGILHSAVGRLHEEWGCRPEELLASVGPAIGPCCFEVGLEVAAHFPGARIERRPRPYVDLPAAVAAQLLSAGVLPDHLELAGSCTACNEGLFHSFRRDRNEERMFSAIRIRRSK